jgi:tetratricopeptide (TPR) repeat protein
MTNPAQVGRRIKRLRLASALSQKQVAEPVISSAYLSLIESGQRSPSPEILEHLADQLGVDTEQILTGRDAGFEARLEIELQRARSHLRGGDATTARTAVQETLKQARKEGLSRIEARALTVLGLVEEEDGDLALAAQLFDEALEVWSDHPAHLRFEAEVGRARCQYLDGGAREAAYQLETYLFELDAHGVNDPTADARVQSTLIHVYRSLGLREKELRAARKADDLSVDIKEPDELACLKINVAGALIDHGEYADAVDAAREAERIYAGLGWPVATARSQINRALADMRRDRLNSARDLLQEALAALDSASPDNPERAYVLNELGHVERLIGNFEDAIRYLIEAAELLPEKDLPELGLNARELGLALVRSNPKKAERELRRALEIFEEAKSPHEVSATLLHIGRLQQAQGKTKQALKTLEEAVEATVGEVR